MTSIVFYDLTKKEPVQAWVHNAWKARLVLNYLGLEYETRFLEFPDVEPTLKALGLSPHTQGQKWAVPAISITTSTSTQHVMGEGVTEVVAALQALVPSTPLYLDAPEVEEAHEGIHELMDTLRSIWMPALFELLTPRSGERFSTKKLQMAREKGDEERVWELARGGFAKIKALLEKHEGVYVLGDHVSYADFVLVGSLQFFRIADTRVYERTVRELPALGRLYEACEKYNRRDW